MMFGFTFRNDIPTRSTMLTLACVRNAWIHRLKYLVTKIPPSRAITPSVMIPSQKRVCIEEGFACASSVGIMGASG